MRQLYPVNQSPFYKLESRKKLAGILGTTVERIQALKASSDLYHVGFNQHGRLIENPKPELKDIQRRVSSLLGRIEFPVYLHSAIKGRSYWSNAEAHAQGERMVKTDISKFYPSTPKHLVFQVFRRDFKCAVDIANTLAVLLTCNGHLPTGGPASPILSYYANKRMFDGLHALSEKAGAKMTVYVDDLTFSGERVSSGLLNKVKKIISLYGYKSHKDATYAKGKVRVVTGAAIKNEKLLLPNRRHKKLSEELSLLRKCKDEKERASMMPSVIGRLNEASQFDSRFKPLQKTLMAECKSEKSRV